MADLGTLSAPIPVLYSYKFQVRNSNEGSYDNNRKLMLYGSTNYIQGTSTEIKFTLNSVDTLKVSTTVIKSVSWCPLSTSNTIGESSHYFRNLYTKNAGINSYKLDLRLTNKDGTYQNPKINNYTISFSGPITNTTLKIHKFTGP